MSGRKCGIYASYIKGCRCDECRDAARNYHRARRQRIRQGQVAERAPYQPAPIDEGNVSWMDRGACRSAGVPTDTVFATQGQGKADTAKDVCAGCNVVDDCLDYALRNNVVGVWGATTTAERKAMKAAARADGRACDTCGADISDRGRSAQMCKPCVDESVRASHARSTKRYYHATKWDRSEAS